MSGIYGFFTLKDSLPDNAVSCLQRWNQPYGGTAEGQENISCFGKTAGFAGAYINHFSDRFPAGASVLKKGKCYFVIDAVLYNRDEMLADKNVPISDEELLADRVLCGGAEGLKSVNGDFAGAVIDAEKGTVTLFRDHMGVRPLYYYLDGSTFAFSTDIRALPPIYGLDMAINEKHLWLDFAGYVSDTLDETEFAKIRCVIPGSTLCIMNKSGYLEEKKTRYWKPAQHKIRLGSDAEYIAEMRHLVEDSIRRRLDSFPGLIGAELSGGLDSSVIDILINRMGRKGKYISWRLVPEDWPLQPVDERIVIRDICTQEGIECEYTPERPATTSNEKDRIEPAFTNTPLIREVARIAAAAGAKCVFSGQGGDEGVSHRPGPLETWHQHEYAAFFREKWNVARGHRFRFLRFLYSSVRDIFWFYPQRKKAWKTELNARCILQPEFVEKMKKIQGPPHYFSIDPVRGFEFGILRLRAETVAYQAAEYGVQYVFPFEDFRVFDYAVSIPRDLYLRNSVNRWIYRQAFDDIMPQTLRDVNYKDFPSWRGMNNDRKNETNQKKDKEPTPVRLLNELDRDFWREYISFERVEKLSHSQNRDDENEKEKLLVCRIKLNSILMIQRMIQNLKR